MIRKKILVFIDWYLPGYKAGGPIRSCSNMIAHLSSEFDFYVITRNTDYMDHIPYSSVITNQWNKLPDGSHVYYVSANNLSFRTIKFILNERQWDCIYLNGIFSYYFTILPLWILRKKNVRVIVAVRGMLAPGALAIKPVKKNLFFLVARIVKLFRKVIFQATSQEEIVHIKKYFPSSKIILAPNLHVTNISERLNPPQKTERKIRLLNVARIAPEKNLLYALGILRQVNSEIEFDFYGPIYDKNYFNDCKKMISQLPQNVIATYKHVVHTSNLNELFKNYHFLFLPSRGENFGHIIIESMLAGVPVIISDNTPWKQLEQKKAGWDISLKNPDKFIRVIEMCCKMNQDEYNVWSDGAYKYANTFVHDNEKLNANRQLFY